MAELRPVDIGIPEMFDGEPGVLVWTGSIPKRQPDDGALQPVRVVRVGNEIRHEQLDGYDSMGLERWNPLEHKYAWKLIDALVGQLEEKL